MMLCLNQPAACPLPQHARPHPHSAGSCRLVVDGLVVGVRVGGRVGGWDEEPAFSTCCLPCCAG